MYMKIVNKYYKKNKEKLQKEAWERYQNLSEEEKEKRQKKPRTDTTFFLKIKRKQSTKETSSLPAIQKSRF